MSVPCTNDCHLVRADAAAAVEIALLKKVLKFESYTDAYMRYGQIDCECESVVGFYGAFLNEEGY